MKDRHQQPKQFLCVVWR